MTLEAETKPATSDRDLMLVADRVEIDGPHVRLVSLSGRTLRERFYAGPGATTNALLLARVWATRYVARIDRLSGDAER